MNLEMNDIDLLLTVLEEEHLRPGNPEYHQRLGTLIMRLREERDDIKFEETLRSWMPQLGRRH